MSVLLQLTNISYFGRTEHNPRMEVKLPLCFLTSWYTADRQCCGQWTHCTISQFYGFLSENDVSKSIDHCRLLRHICWVILCSPTVDRTQWLPLFTGVSSTPGSYSTTSVRNGRSVLGRFVTDCNVFNKSIIVLIVCTVVLTLGVIVATETGNAKWKYCLKLGTRFNSGIIFSQQ